MSKIYIVAAYIVILLVATIVFALEMVAKAILFAFTLTLCFVLMLLAPLITNRRLQFMDPLMDYAFSFKFIVVSAVVNKYANALGL